MKRTRQWRPPAKMGAWLCNLPAALQTYASYTLSAHSNRTHIFFHMWGGGRGGKFGRRPIHRLATTLAGQPPCNRFQDKISKHRARHMPSPAAITTWWGRQWRFWVRVT
eukprot:351382-Chlamydomonas_euryale.AAC.4